MNNENISYLALGLCFGVTFGLVFNNLTICMCLGLLIGAALDNKKNK
ncbi:MULTISPECIES: hypothetical protein [Romboutsia]|jgi:hypothetical protein|nr:MULTISPECIES: hypothetical protein [Romboutsia]MCI9061146.1 hypothetical protein [Romboutsia sp.]